MITDLSGVSDFVCAQGMQFLLHSTLLLAAALLVALFLIKTPLVRSAIYRAALLAALLAPMTALALQQLGLAWSVRHTPPPFVAAPVTDESRHAALTADAPDTSAAMGGEESAIDTAPAATLPPLAVPAKASWPRPTATVVLSALWAAGTALLLLRLLLSHIALWRIRRRSAAVLDPSTLAKLEFMAHQLGVPAPDLRTSPDIGGPVLTGIRHPVILIPLAQDEDLRRGALDRVLLHELAHRRRGDCLWGLLSQLACALAFFQPLLWALARRLEEAREDAVDDVVLALGADARDYARDLAATAERFLPTPPESVAGLGMLRRRSSLARRVARILDTTRRWAPSLSWRVIAMVIASTVLATILTACLSLAAPAASAPPLSPAMGAPTDPATAPAAPVVETPRAKPDPKEEKIQAILDKEIAAISLPDVTLQDAIDILKTQVGRDVNFEIDIKVLTTADILIRIDLKNVTLRRVLDSMLHPQGLAFITRDGIIYISTVEGCRREEARPENLSLRVYDVSDVLAAFPRQAGQEDNRFVAADFLHIVVQYTGQIEWDTTDVPYGIVSPGAPVMGMPGMPATGPGGMPAMGPGAAGAAAPSEPGRPSRMLLLRGDRLMVRHCPRVHKEIEKCLAELRGQMKEKPSKTSAMGEEAALGRPSKEVLEQRVEKIDSTTDELVTLRVQEWDTLGQQNFLFKNPRTGKYTMAEPVECLNCGRKIPALAPPVVGSSDPVTDQAHEALWAKLKQQQKCKHCGKNPFAPDH